jgi:hypothetical protein
MDWRVHIDYLTSKLSLACYAIRTLKQIMSQKTIMIYYAYFNSLMTQGIIFWDNSSYSIHIFRLQEKLIRTITNSKNRYSCRNLFKNVFSLLYHNIYFITILDHY